MASKFVVLVAALAVVRAEYLSQPSAHYGAPTYQTHALTSTSDNILRSHGNLAQVATQMKTITTPHSSASKSDIRVSNPGVYTHAVPVGYAQHAPPAYSHAPAVYSHAPAPAVYSHAPTYGAYSHAPAPAVYSHAPAPAPAPAPAVYSHAPAPAPAVYSHAPASAAYSHAPAPASYVHSPAHAPMLGVAYSSAGDVSHMNYVNVNDHVNYAW